MANTQTSGEGQNGARSTQGSSKVRFVLGVTVFACAFGFVLVAAVLLGPLGWCLGGIAELCLGVVAWLWMRAHWPGTSDRTRSRHWTDAEDEKPPFNEDAWDTQYERAHKDD